MRPERAASCGGVAVLGPASGPEVSSQPLQEGGAGHSTQWAALVSSPTGPQGGIAAPAAATSRWRAERPAPHGSKPRKEGTGRSRCCCGKWTSGRRGPTWKRRGAAVELPAAEGAGASAAADGGHAGGASPSGPAVAGRARKVSGIPGRVPGPAQGREQSAEETRGARAPRTERREGVAEAAAPPRGPGARVRS